ncbi:hypothetical protein MTO96_024473 [Rhipicephalus appendiculatus]
MTPLGRRKPLPKIAPRGAHAVVAAPSAGVAARADVAAQCGGARAARANAGPEPAAAAAALTECVRVSGVEEYPIGAARLARARVAAPSLAGGCAGSWERPWLPPRVCGSPLTLAHRVLRGGRNVSDLVRGHPHARQSAPKSQGRRQPPRGSAARPAAPTTTTTRPARTLCAIVARRCTAVRLDSLQGRR